MTPWQCARIRMHTLLRSSSVRIELIAVIAMLVLMFGTSFPTWWRRWTVPTMPQTYAILILPLVAAWLYLNRWRIMLPELDSLNERFTETSVIRFLIEEEVEEPKRLRWPLVSAALLTPCALYAGDPTLTCLAFVGLLVGIIGYRLGTFALRVLAFPLALLAFIVPVPGIILDASLKRAIPALLRLVTNLLSTVGIEAEVTNEGNPIQIPPEPKAAIYSLYAGQTGLGVVEFCVFLVFSAWWLSLMQGTFLTKLRVWIVGCVGVGFLMVVRLVLLGVLGANLGDSLDGKDWVAIIATLTRWLLPVAGLAGQWFLMRLLKVNTRNEWVSK